ncbi:putative ribonuclease H-like domain-containing protein [Tanacetum coccineum]
MNVSAIFHQKTVSRTPQHNGVVERRNRTLVEAVRTMMIFSKASMFLWAEVVATASRILENYNQQLILEFSLAMHQVGKVIESTTKEPDVSWKLFMFNSMSCLSLWLLCNSVADRTYLSDAAEKKVQGSTQFSSVNLMLNPPTNKELENFIPNQCLDGMPRTSVLKDRRPVSPTLVVPVLAGTPSSTTIDQDAPSPSYSLSSSALQSLSFQQGFVAESTSMEDNPLAPVDNDPFINVFAPKPSSKASSSGDVSSAESTYVTQTHNHLRKWSKDHPLDNVIGNASRPVSTRKHLTTDALWCLYNSALSKLEPKNFKSANIVRDSPSPADAETCARSDMTSSIGDTEIVQILEELGEDVEKQENVQEKTAELDQDQAGSDPGETLESRPQLKQVHMEEDQLDQTLKLSDLEQNNKNIDNTTRNLISRVYTLELRDLPYNINEAVRENVKKAVQTALQAPLRDRFRDLSEEDMKEMIHQRMFETGSYKSLPEHIALYEALEASMERAQRDEFLAKKDKFRKRRRDDQDPPPPPPDSLLSKRRQHDAGASGSSQPQAP